MNAVATRPKAAQAGELRVTSAPAPAVLPEWKSLLACLLNDLREVSANVAEIGDKIGPDEPAICTLLDCALDEIYKVKHNLEARPLYVATTDAAYEALYKPLAHLQGAAAMARLMGVDIFSGAIEKATALLDEAHNGLSDQAIGVLLPTQPAAPQAAESEFITPPPTGTDWTSAELAYIRLGEAEAVIRAAAEDGTSPTLGSALWAAARVTDLAKGCIPLGTPVDWSALSAAGALLSQAEAVLELVTKDNEDVLADAGLTLLQAAQEHISAAEGEVRRG